MVFEAKIENEIPILHLSGRFDAYEVPQMDEWFEDHIETYTYVIVDFLNVTFIDTRALSTLVKWMKKLREKDGDLKLTRFSNPVRVIFELSRLDKAFSIYTSITDALADCEGVESQTVSYNDAPEDNTQAVDTDNLHVITLSKRIDAFKVPELQELYGEVITEEHPFAIIDLSTVEFLDSAALAWLVKMLKRTQSVKGDLILIRSQIEVANRIFHLTQFDKVFKFAHTIDEAVSLLV